MTFKAANKIFERSRLGRRKYIGRSLKLREMRVALLGVMRLMDFRWGEEKTERVREWAKQDERWEKRRWVSTLLAFDELFGASDVGSL